MTDFSDTTVPWPENVPIDPAAQRDDEDDNKSDISCPPPPPPDFTQTSPPESPKPPTEPPPTPPVDESPTPSTQQSTATHESPTTSLEAIPSTAPISESPVPSEEPTSSPQDSPTPFANLNTPAPRSPKLVEPHSQSQVYPALEIEPQTPPPESNTPPPEYQNQAEAVAYSETSDGQVNVVCTTHDEDLDIKPYPDTSQSTEEGATVTVVSTGGDHVRIEIREKPNDYIELSICACFLNFIFGMIAFNYSLKAQKSWKDGDRKKAKRQGLCALGWSLASLIILALVIVVVVWFEVVSQVNGEMPEEVMDYTTTMSSTI